MIYWRWQVKKGDRVVAEGTAPNIRRAEQAADMVIEFYEQFAHMFMGESFQGEFSSSTSELGDLR